MLFNCTAGKDRTGVTAMLLLLLAGVRAEDAGVHLARCNAPQAASPADMAALSEEFSEAERARLAQILR